MVLNGIVSSAKTENNSFTRLLNLCPSHVYVKYYKSSSINVEDKNIRKKHAKKSSIINKQNSTYLHFILLFIKKMYLLLLFYFIGLKFAKKCHYYQHHG